MSFIFFSERQETMLKTYTVTFTAEQLNMILVSLDTATKTIISQVHAQVAEADKAEVTEG